MITEDYVSFEIAKLLEKKGFDEQTVRCYNLRKELCVCQCRCNETINSTPNYLIAAPTLQMVMKWLREVHNIDISITPDRKENYTAMIFVNKELPFTTISSFKTYEVACEAAIKHELENLI